MRNLFTHLFSFSEKDQVKIEKDQVRQNGRGGSLARFLWVRRSESTANSMSVGSEAEGSTMVYKSPANDTLITGLSRGNHALLHCFGVDKTSLRFLRYVAMIFAVLMMSMANIGVAWGAEYSGTVTFYKGSSKLTTSTITNSNASVTFTYTDLSANSSSGNICSTGSQYGIKGKNTKLITVTCPSGYYFKSAVFYLGSFGNTETPTAEIISGSTSLYSTKARKFTKMDACGEEFSCEDSISGFVANKYTTLTVKEKGNSKNLGVTKLVYTIESAAPSTKRIYMKAGDWNNDSPKFFVHSWGSSDSDVQLTALGGCESDVFYADIPSGNTSLIFTRQNPSTSSIIWDGSDLWNRTDNISISTYDLFTFATWNGGPSSRSTFTGGTYSAPTTYTITYAANGGGGSMSATSGICPDADQAITSNAFTAPTGCASFAHWTANVAVKVGGATVAAGSPIANGATIQDINSNITLTAVWKLTAPTIADNGDNTFSISGSMAGSSYYYTTNGDTPTTSSSLYSSAVDFSAGEANITAKAIAHKDGYVDSDVASQACVYHEPPVCAISECGNATLTYVINASTSVTNTAANLISSATASNTTALGINGTAVLSTIGISSDSNKGKAAANTSACYPTTAPTMTSKIGIYNGASYSSSNYLQFTFTVKEGYTFTPCDIQFVVQPVSNPASFRWEVTDGTNIYGYGTANNVAKGSDGGASVLTGITSPSAMEAGTYYIRLYPFYNGSNTFRLGTDVILKGTTAAAACVAPTTVNITGTYHYFPGETISLTAAAEGGSGTPTTYQWYKGGTADGNIIEGATSATYSKASCTFADAGSYYCKVTRGGSCSTFSDNYDVKILHLYVKTGRNGTAYGDVDFVKVDATTARATISLGASWDYGFNIADGCGHYYGNTGSMNESNCTGWTMNVDGTDCLMRTTNGATYTFTVDYTTLTAPVVSITYPSANQAADKVIYFDNNDRNWSTLHYRIGRTNHTQATPMTKVPGTANLYKVTTAAYNNFSGWHIANNAGWTGDNNSIYRTYTNGDAYSITYATAHEGGAVTESAVTVTPTTSRGNGSDVGINDNCEFYNYSIASGMKRDRVTITAPVNGTITVNYTSEEDVASSFSATTVDMYQDLAHTVIITPTATPAEGYTLSGLTVNGAAHTSGNTYTVTANTTIAATFSPASYTVTLNTNGGTINAGNVTSYTYGTGATLPTNVTKDGFTFGGWYDNSGLTGSAVTTISTTATGNKEYWAKWTAAASLTALECNTLYKVEDMVPASITLSGTGQYGAGLSANTKFEVIGDPAEAGNAGGTPEMKNEAASFAEQSFTARMYLKGASNTTGSGTTFVPTSRAVKFIVSESGTLDIYAHRVDRLYLKKVGDSGTTQLGTSTSGSGSMVSHNVTAGTYYIYSVNSSTCVYGVRLNCCTTPAAPTGFTAGSITSTGATFSITDAGNAASYDIYYSTSSTAPTAVTAATTTSDSKTKAVTGLTASTTYYAWVRSVCDADHKSAWVALSGSSFTTTSTPAELTAIEANVLYQAADMANITFTGSDQHFTGLSTNAKFKVYGTLGSSDAFGKNENHNVTDDIDTKNFTSALYITAADNTSSSSDPTKGAIEFITPSTAGTLYLYLNTSSSSLSIKKKGTSTSTSLSGGAYKKIAVEANTHYFINGAGSNRGLYGIKFIADVTAPTFVSSVPANGATGVATSGTIVLTFSEALGSVDASKFTLTGATKGAVAIDGSDATKVNIAYSGAANEATVILATAAAAVSDLAGNALAAALSNISFTTAAAAPAGDCDELFAGRATSTSVFTPSAGSATFNLSSGNSFSAGGYSYSVKPNSSNAIVASPKAGGSFAAGDSLIVVIYNNESGPKTMGFRLGSGTYSTSVGSKKLHIFRQVLVASDISAGKVTFNRQSSDDRWVEIIIKRCGLLPSCTTPELPTLDAKTVCEGGDADAAWNATITNSGSLVSGETVAYSWVKKGGSTPVSSVATYQPTDVTEAMAGTYVVTATVSADGKASKSASQEVDLNVTEGTEAPTVTQSTTPVYEDNSVTLTATATTGATYTWHTCNADGTGESSAISGATTNAYTIASAPAAGTHYYKVKVTGDGTHTCGNAETVYALTVSAATGGDCDTYYFFANAADATTNSVTQNEESFFSGASEGTNNNSTSITVDENSLSISKRTSAGAYSVVFTVPTGATATLYTNAKANNTSYPLIITRSSDSEVMEITNSTTLANYTLADIPEGTWTLSSGSGKNWYYGAIIVKVCTGATCTDPAVTASVSRSSVCAGDVEGITFTASDAHADASYQWQKQNGSTWDDISSATAATYTIITVEASHAGKYRVVASHECDRISNELTLTVATTPVFGDLGSAREVETGGSLSITDVEATNTTGYKWYKSANATYDSGSDEQVGTSKNLMLPVNETAGSTFYLFCVASNACTSTVSSAITVNVIAPVEKDCAVGTSNGENFTTAKTSSVSSGTYNGQTELHMNSNNKYIYYIAASGYHFETATVNCCAGDATALTKAAYSYSTDGGETWTDADLPGAMTNQYSDHVVTLSADVNAFRVGRVLGDHGVGSNTLYVHEVCFTYVADCNATTIAVSNATPSYDLSVGGDFTEPTCTVKQGSTTLSPQPALRYSSFNEDIATVDPSTGDVDFTGMAGSVMIMASYDGDGTYCESSATYTITVTCGSESAPKIVAGSGTNLSGCNSEVNLVVKDQSDNDFASGSYQWYRDGEEIEGATSASYTAERTGTYTVSHTGACTQMSTNSAVVTSESFDPSVERLAPFQYYHANKTYTEQMKMRHLFAVTSGGDYEGKRYYMTATRNGAPLDITTSTAFSVRTSNDNRVDSVMIDLNRLNGKFNAGDEIVLTCAAIADCGTISAVTEDIEIHVIDNTPTLALICSGTNKSAGTRKTGELTVGGDFLTGYNKADLCEQTGKTSFDASTEWGLYTELKEHYIVTPVNGYAVFNKLNYEPFDILLLTDYPKASKSTEAALILDDMYELCDYRPMLSFKAHMVQPADELDGRESHWMRKGFTTLPVVPVQTRQRLNIVCYAHPMFKDIKGEGVARDYDDISQIVYTMLSGPGYESSKGMQGFHLAAAENFVTIGLIHNDATPTDNYEGSGDVKWTPGSKDEMLVAAAERQTNLEARFILFSINCGAQSKLTEQGHTVVLKCLEYLLNDATIKENIADCSLTFDNKTGDGKWSTGGNWAPDYTEIPGMYNSARIAAPATVDIPHAKALSIRIMDGGRVTIPAGSGLEVKSTVRHQGEDDEIYPTEISDIHIGSDDGGNGTLIFNNNSGDTKARVDMYSTAKTAEPDPETGVISAAASNWQYIGTPHSDVASATRNYYDSWLYQYSGSGWEVIPNGGPLVPFRGYCVTHPAAPVVFDMAGTLVATTTQDIAIPAGYTVIANSWVAPIDITTFTDDDMEGISDKSIYFFNTGHDANGTAGTGTEAGTYVAVPKNSASYMETWQIPSMQGFYISTTSAGTLHLDYDRHVRPHSARDVVSSPMYAPRRAKAAEEEPAVLKIFARGSRYQDKLVVLEREDFTRGYDSGWDGEAWGGGTLSPMVYVTGEGREDAVSAIPEFEGTVVAFKAGEDDAYTLYFEYLNSDEPLYLYDVEANVYTQIMNGNAYYFSTSDKAPHSRFILTRKSPSVTTEIDNVQRDNVPSTKARKILIEDKLFIMINGLLYDATGKVVK